MAAITDGIPASPTSLTVRTPTEDDWPAMYFLASVSFSDFIGPEAAAVWRTVMPADGAVVVCDGSDVVGMALYLDLRMTVPGGAVLPTAGLSSVAVAPTHRRRGSLRAMCAELHRRIAGSGYPVAALYASEGGIYGRFGYGPATVAQELSVDRRSARFHAPAAGAPGVRLVRPTDHRDELAAIHDRWRQRVSGGVLRPAVLWDELLLDRASRGRELFAFLHRDGYALFRVDAANPKVARVTEFRALDGEAHAALWRALLGLDSMQTVIITTHGDDPLPYLLVDPRVARTTARGDALWLRIMDVAAALEARTYQADLSTVLGIADVGRYALEIRDGRARCAPTDATAEIELGLDVLGSLYLGAHRATTLAAANRLRCKDSGLVRGLEAAFASDVPIEAGVEF